MLLASHMGQILTSKDVLDDCSTEDKPHVLGMEDPNALLWALLYEGDLENLRKLTPEMVDIRSLHPKTGVTVLVFVIDRHFEHEQKRRDYEEYQYAAYPGVKIIAWLLSIGADATQKVSPRAKSSPIKLSWVAQDFCPEELTVSHSGHSAVSYLVEWKRVLEQNGGWRFYQCELGDFAEELFNKAFAQIARATSTQQSRRKAIIDESLVERWERIFHDISSHNVTFETADVPVTAHDWMLKEASPVLKAMLQSSLQEGQKQCIQVADSPSLAVSLFLEILYTSSVREDPNFQTVLLALDLAHRWQVAEVVAILSEILEDLVSDESFAAIAEASCLKQLERLHRLCQQFATKSNAVKRQLREGTLPPRVQEMLGQPRHVKLRARRF